MYMDGKTKAAYIKDHVSMADVISRYHHPGKRPWRTSCPFHGGEHDNLGYDNRVFHCFVCGAKGDVIDFASRMAGLDFPETLKLLNADFGLGFEGFSNSELSSLREAQRSRDELAAREKERRRRVHKTFVLFTRIMRWIRCREVQTEIHTAQWEFLDRQTDILLSGKDYAGDPKAAAKAVVQRVREAEKNAG